jgi:protein-disulfide isomerase
LTSQPPSDSTSAPAQIPAAPATPRGPGWTTLLPVLALVATAALWYRTDSQLADLRESHLALAAEFARVNRVPLVDLTGAATLGPADAPVVLIEFSDYECPYCIRHTRETMPKIEEQYIRTGRIRYAFRDFPIDQLHPEAIRAHEAARCAAEQNRFWDVHKRLFSAPGTHTTAALEALAGELGLRVDDFRACLASGRTTAAIRSAANVAMDLGANGTPAFFIGVPDASGQVKILTAINGAQSFEVFAKTLDEILKQQAR